MTLMDLDTYEQVSVPSSTIGDAAQYLKEEVEVQALTADGEVLGYEVPNFVVLKVTSAEPGVRGNTATGGVLKGATLETGAAVQVPMHIEEGDNIKIDTRSGAYIERVNKG
jgi:elongation factor P